MARLTAGLVLNGEFYLHHRCRQRCAADCNSSQCFCIVLRKPLTLHSTKPMTGFMRDGYCRVPPSDFGNHSVAGTLFRHTLAIYFE